MTISSAQQARRDLDSPQTTSLLPSTMRKLLHRPSKLQGFGSDSPEIAALAAAAASSSSSAAAAIAGHNLNNDKETEKEKRPSLRPRTKSSRSRRDSRLSVIDFRAFMSGSGTNPKDKLGDEYLARVFRHYDVVVVVDDSSRMKGEGWKIVSLLLLVLSTD